MISRARWTDLGPRIVTALVLAAAAGTAIVAGGVALAALAVVAGGVLTWELAHMTRGQEGPDLSIPLALLASLVLALILFLPGARWPVALLLAPALSGVLTPRREGALFAAASFVIMLATVALVMLREVPGLAGLLAVVLAVIACDVAGYFAGRALGGPKLWPRVSPNKTWSGTVAGWLAAFVIGLGFWLAGAGGVALLWLLPLIALASQAGDIAESALKRRMGVKDSSALLPGHGGLMDRFDGLSFALILALGLAPFLPVAAAAAVAG